MFFYKHRRRFHKFLKRKINYYHALLRSSRIAPQKKKLYIDVSNIVLNRYLYNFLKFFSLCGYTVYLPRDEYIIDYLSQTKGEFRFASGLLTEGFVKFGFPEEDDVLIISSRKLSNDYFTSLFEKSVASNSYHVPMSEFPLVYSRFWKKPKLRQKGKSSVFMIGNMNPNLYSKISKNQQFKILSRREVADFLLSKDYSIRFSNFSDFQKFLLSKHDKKAILIDTSSEFSIGLEQLKEVLSQFHFFLALPGIIIPPSHNIVEAMSVGCIPILHTNYARTFRPNLRNGIDAIFYENLSDLNNKMTDVFNLSEEMIHTLQQNVLIYYSNHLSPEAVVTKIERNCFSKIYIQAENVSLNMYQQVKEKLKSNEGS